MTTREIAKVIETNVDLQVVAERIRARIQRTTADIIETGNDLIQVKAKLDHGDFNAWIEAEFGMTGRTAQRYMQAAEWLAGKNDIVSHLPLTTIYLLAAKTTPEEIKTKVLSDVEAGNAIDMHEVKARIKMARSERRIDRSEDLKKQARNHKRSAKIKRQREQARAEWEAQQRLAESTAEKAAAILLKLDGADLDALIKYLEDYSVIAKLRASLIRVRGSAP